MSVITDLFDRLRFGGGEYEEDEYDEYDEIEEVPVRNTRQVKRAAVTVRDEEYEDEARPRAFQKPKTVPAARKSMEVVLVKPTKYDNVNEISDLLRDGKAVVLNMEGLHMELSQRIIDFVSGSTYTLDGKLQKISNYIFIATPPAVTVSGEISELLQTSAYDMAGFSMRI